MKIRVRCANCGTIFDRVTNFGGEVEFTDDLCYNCPKCSSNAYDVIVEKIKKERGKN